MIPKAWRTIGWLATGAMLLLITACATPLPTYPEMSDADALRTIAARLDSVHSLSASTDLVLTSAKGESVSLDGAFVATPPTRARLRAWKFGTPVLDLTILPQGVWAFAATREGAAPADLTKLPAAGVSRAVELLTGSYFASARVVPDQSTPATLVVTGAALGQDHVRCEIDRATLTPRVFHLVGRQTESAPRAMTLTLDRYAIIDGVAWVRRLRFTSPDGEILLRLSDVELNADLNPAAFTPPQRATRLP